ncbi:MAG: TonB-dependent receptor [Bacteroidia bacterium]|nr:TonB-dependent receptor [Bacteroidia bacterium]
MQKHKSLFLFFLLAALVGSAQQKYTISGYVNEKGSLENLPGVTIYQPNTKNATTSNIYGFYSITLPAADSVTLSFAFIGFTTQNHVFKLNKDQTFNVLLNAQSELQEVEIVAKKNEPVSEDVQMSKIDISIEKVKDIPALLGEKDVMKVIQLMPGVQKGSEGSSGFYVRGGGPDQNLIILDEATVYNAFHLFGFFSLFNGDALKSVELTKGGFPARYGGRLSSVLDMQMKDGNKEKISGEAGIGLISSRLTLEGPLIKNKCSFLVSGRRTYADALIYPFLPKDSKGGYYFYDLNAKINYVLNDKDRIYLSGYFGKDKFYLNNKDGGGEDKVGLNWGNATATARWNHLFTNKLFCNTSLIFTDYKLIISAEEKYKSGDNFSLRYTSGIRDYSIKTGFDYIPNPQHYIKFGLQGIYHQFRPGAIVIKSSSFDENLDNTKLIEAFENSIFVEDDWKISGRWRLNAGIRASNYIVRKENYINPEPRASLRFKIKEDLSLKASYAMMNQYMHLLSNTGIGLPTDLWVPATKNAPFMRSQQVALGLAKDFLKKGYDISLEGYYKKMDRVLGYREGASFLSVFNGEGNEITWEDNVTSGQGWSYGAEVLIRKNEGKFTGWIGYTLSWTQLQFDELNFGKKFYARYDRRHDISVVGVYHVNKRMTLSFTWVYGTGNAITLPLNTYNAYAYAGPMSGNVQGPSNQMDVGTVQDFGQQRNAFRMSAYHRLDFGVQWHKKFKHVERVFEIGIYNVYSRQNPYFYYIEIDQNGNQKLMQVSLFPIIPSFTWSWKF